MCTPSPRRQRGTSLLEALVAFLVLSVGMISIARLQGNLRLDADVARQRSEAVRLAQADIEMLRGFASTATLSAAPEAPSFDAIGSTSSVHDNGTAYQVERVVEQLGATLAKSASITVRWTDRSGTPQQLALHSIIAGTDPGLTGALLLASR